MKFKNALVASLGWICTVIYLSAGIFVLVSKFSTTTYDYIILGTVLLVSGFTRVIVYLLTNAFKEPEDISIVVGSAMVALGFIFLFSNYDLEILCFGWGVLELVSSGIEILQKGLKIKENPIIIFEVVISLGAFVFAILLCIHNTEALHEHLIFLGISMILLSVYQALIQIQQIRGKKNA